LAKNASKKVGGRKAGSIFRTSLATATNATAGRPFRSFRSFWVLLGPFGSYGSLSQRTHPRPPMHVRIAGRTEVLVKK
jgi:hypothetical protein